MHPVHLVYLPTPKVLHPPIVPPATGYSIQIYSWLNVIYQHCQLPTPDHLYTQNNFASMNATIFGHQHPRNSECNHDARVCLYWIRESVRLCQYSRHSNASILSFCQHYPIRCNKIKSMSHSSSFRRYMKVALIKWNENENNISNGVVNVRINHLEPIYESNISKNIQQ